MKKVERMNTMMRYMNNRGRFTISEIMEEFAISRSTAIRDIREIEAMGMPLVSEVGRDGGYFVMNNSVLPTVRFTDNEIKALFIAFLASRNQQLPYLTSRQSLAEKLLGLISQNQQDDLIVLNKILLFEGTNPNNPDLLELTDLPHPMLEQLINVFLSDQYLWMTVKEGELEQSYPIYLLHLYREKSSWFIEGFDFNNEERRIIAVDSLTNVTAYSRKTRVSREQIIEKLNRQKEASNLVVELGQKAIAQFKKYHPLQMSIAYIDPFQTRAMLKTFLPVNHAEKIDEMVNWLLFLGDDIQIIEMPKEISTEIQERLSLFYP